MHDAAKPLGGNTDRCAGGRHAWRHGGMRVLAATLLWLAALAPVMAQDAAGNAPAASRSEVGSDAAELAATVVGAESPVAQLEALLRLAPNRQLGQPGNEAVSALIRDHFESVVNAENPADRWAEAQAAAAAGDAANAQVREAIAALYRGSHGEGKVSRSGPLLHYTVESPWMMCVVFLVIGLVMMLTWRSQGRSRPSMLVASWFFGAAGVALPLLAALVTTKYEAAAASPDTGAVTFAGLTRAVDAAAAAAYTADLDAAGALSGMWQHGRVPYSAPAFEPGDYQIQGPGGTAKLYQLSPNWGDPGNLPEEGFTGPLIYIGDGSPEELAGKDLTGSAVIMNFSSGKRWLDMVQLGAEVVIFLEPAGEQVMTLDEAVAKLTNTPLSVPRLYLRRAGIGKLFPGQDESQALITRPEVTISGTPGRWVRKQVYADWLLVPGTEAATGGNFRTDPGQQLVHVVAYKDASSVVPDLSPGAQSAANLVTMFRLIEQYREQLPPRPVLITALNDHVNALSGESELAHALFHTAASFRDELDYLARELARQRHIANVFSQEPTHALLQSLRTRTDIVANVAFEVKEPIVDRITMLKNEAREQAARNRTLARAPGVVARQTPEELIAEAEKLEAIKDDYIQLSKLFNRFGRKTYLDPEAVRRDTEEALTSRQREMIVEVFAALAATAQERCERLEERISNVEEALKVRRRLLAISAPEAVTDPEPSIPSGYTATFAARHQPLPSAMVLTLDLSFSTGKLGFFYMGYELDTNTGKGDEYNRIVIQADLAKKIAETVAASTGMPNLLAETVLKLDGPWEGHMGGRFPAAARMFQKAGHGALTLMGVDDLRQQEFTPHDTLAQLNQDRFETATRFLDAYLPALIGAKDLGVTVRQVGTAQSLSLELQARLYDQGSAKLPSRVLEGALVHGMSVQQKLMSTQEKVTMRGHVRPFPMMVTDVRGAAMIRGELWEQTSYFVLGYDETFRNVRHVTGFGESGARFAPVFDLRKDDSFVSRPLIAFSARKVDLIGLTDPLTLEPILRLEVLDGRQNSEPRDYAVAGIPGGGTHNLPDAGDGSASVFVEPDTPFKLRYGGAVAIHVTQEEPEGVGFSPHAGLLRNIIFVSAKDMQTLTHERLESLESKGVTSPTARSFNIDANAQIEDATEVADGRKLVAAEKARGLAFQAYEQGKSTIDDLITAVVIFLAMVIPFCFFLMKLVTPFTDVNRQLGLFMAIFAFMALLLFLVHPAFKVASSPYQVILAFVILGLAVFVSSVVFSRFNTAMNQAVEESQLSESAEAPQSRLAGAAFMVGVNNMKRRRIRTALTTATIVLVTFTMLSVISVGQDVEPARVRLPESPIYSGMLYSSPGMGPIDPLQFRRMRSHLQQQGEVVARGWVQSVDANGAYMPYDLSLVEAIAGAPVDHLEIKVMLGLEPGEDGFIAPMPLTEGSRWFSSGDAKEIVLSVEAANLMGIDAENFEPRDVWVRGMRLHLIGLVRDAEVEAILDLDETPLLPVLVDPTPDAQEMMKALQASTSADASGGDLLSVPGAYVARPVNVAMIPLGLAQSLGSSFTPRTLSLKMSPGEAGATAADRAWETANELIRYQRMRLAVSLDEVVRPSENARPVAAGQYALTSSSGSQITGVLKIAIPTILGATIILNTMLGSVMERRREISIYNAIGLNPSHVMVFFLAESLVFGLVGAVAGYLIGQILSVAIVNLNLLELNLNYSSLSVIVVIFLTITTVLLSTVYPAMMAAREAVPSGQRRWALPQPDGDEIHVDFPFSYDASRVLGICAYLHDFMNQNSEASTGKFLAKPVAIGRVPAPVELLVGAGKPDNAGAKAEQEVPSDVYVLVYDVAPAPFDLGVNQKMEVYAYYNPRVRAHMLAVHLTRESGQVDNWMAVNQPFLELLRKRLLGWRSQRAEVQQVYYTQGQALLANAPMLATRPTSTSA